MQCLLFRHGIAVSPQEWTGTEPDRPLTKEGRAKTRKAVEGIRRLTDPPTHILCSPFIRTQETAGIAREVLGVEVKVQLCPELVFDQPTRLLISLLRGLPRNAMVLCVGHEPHLGQTAALMLTGKECPGLSLKKAGACLIGFEKEVQPGWGFLEWWIPPAPLRMLGKGE